MIFLMGYKSSIQKSQYQKQWMQKRRNEWFAVNGPCVQCGSSCNLELDHINPVDKIDHKVWSWAKERMEKELKKCQVLCKKCHRRKTNKQLQRAIIHGTVTAYHYRKCRCRPCVVAAYQYEQRRRLRKSKPIAGDGTCLENKRA